MQRTLINIMITFVKACTDMYQKTCSLEQYSAIAAYKQQD